MPLTSTAEVRVCPTTMIWYRATLLLHGWWENTPTHPLWQNVQDVFSTTWRVQTLIVPSEASMKNLDETFSKPLKARRGVSEATIFVACAPLNPPQGTSRHLNAPQGTSRHLKAPQGMLSRIPARKFTPGVCYSITLTLTLTLQW